MTVTSNIDVLVDDEKFKAFAKVFEAHKAAVDQLPAAWKTATETAVATRTEFEKSATALAEQAASSAAINKEVGQLTQTSGALAHHWHLMRLNTQGVASNIKDMTSSLLSWGGTLGKLTGLALGGATAAAGLGITGFWGMDKLGQSVAAKRMRARGLGTSIGGVASFETAFARFGDTGAMLSGANVAKTDVSSAERRALGNIGISNAQIDKLPSDELAALEYQKIKEKSDTIKEDNNFYGPMASLGFTDHAMLQTVRQTPRSELEGLEKQFRTDKPKMNIGEDAAKKWVEFTQEVTRVTTTLENKFEVRLSELGPSLSKLSEEFGKAAGVFIDKDLGPWIGKAADGLEWLASKVGSNQAKSYVTGFFDDIKSAAELMGGVVHKLAEVGKWLGISPANAALESGRLGSGFGPGSSPAGMEFGPQLPGHSPGGGAGPGDRGGGQSGGGEYNVKKAYDLIKAAGGSDEEARTLAAIAQPESGGNPKAHNKQGPDNSYGLWQINMLGAMGPNRRAKYGLSSNEDLFDPAMHREAGGYRDWSTYSSGAYKRYLGGEAGAGDGGSKPLGIPQNPGVDLEHLNPDFHARLDKLIGAGEASGHHIGFRSGYRSSEHQAEIYAHARPGFAARPGHSMHERGLAADLTGDLDWANQHAHEFGLTFPLRHTRHPENWHIEPESARNKTDKPKVSIRSMPGSNVWSQAFAVNAGRA